MKKTNLTFILLSVAAISMNAQNTAFPKLTGPYLGQKPPGIVPEVFAPGIVSREGIQSKAHLTPDGKELIYMSMQIVPGEANTPSSRQISFLKMKLVGGTWTPPVVLSFSNEYTNDEPALSPDGNHLFFVSNRPRVVGAEPEKMPDIWVVIKTGSGWSEPQNVGAPVNTDDVEVQPFFGVDKKLYFGRRDGIYCSQLIEGRYAEPVKLDTSIFKGRLSGICISPDNTLLIVHSNRPGGFGNWDLYGSRKDQSGNWTELVNLGNVINTGQSEANATFSPDGKYLFFTRGDDIYWVSTQAIKNRLERKEYEEY